MKTPSLKFACLTAIAAFVVPGAWAQSYLITTVAGGGLPPTGLPGLNLPINSPSSLAADSFGNQYFILDNCVFKLDSSGIMTRFAGSSAETGFAGDGGLALDATLSQPSGLAVDRFGNLFIADSRNYRIRKVGVDGIITTIAGTGSWGSSPDGALATESALGFLFRVAVDASGTVYFTSAFYGETLRKILADGTIGTALADVSGFAWAVDGAGNIYQWTVPGYTIQKIAVDGTVTTLAGGKFGDSGDGGPAIDAGFYNISDLEVDATGELLIADVGSSMATPLGPLISSTRIRKIGLDGIINTIAGNGTSGFSGDGGPATSAALSSVGAIALDSVGNLYLDDYVVGVIRRVGPDGKIATLAGSRAGTFFGDGGNAVQAGLSFPNAVALDASGNLYVADLFNQKVRKIAPDGTISTVAGNGTQGFAGDGGPATNAELNYPEGLALDSIGNLFIVDSLNNRIRKVATDGTITTIAGTGLAASTGDGGAAAMAQLNHPQSIAIDKSGLLYVSESFRVRRINADGKINTVVGNGTDGFSGDGGPATSAQISLSATQALAFDSAGNLYVADTQNGRIRKVSMDGNISTFAGIGGVPADGVSFGYIAAIAVDQFGNIDVADSGNDQIRRITSDGTISTIAGLGTAGYSGDGGPATNAGIGGPYGIAVRRDGVLYFPDFRNNVVRALVPEAGQAFLTVAATQNGNLYRGETGATYSLSVANAVSAGPSHGTVTVSFALPPDLTFVSASGEGWVCGSVCTRNDVLGAGSSYPAITLIVNVSSTAISQETIMVTVTGGGSLVANASNVASVYDSSSPTAPALTSPANGTGGVSHTPSLTWTGSTNTYYDVYFGTTPNPPLLASVAGPAYNPATLAHGTLYYWKVIARNPTGSAESWVSVFATDVNFQTITFNAISAHTYGDAPFTVSATDTSGLPVTLTGAGPCSISGATLSITGAGSCTITASQAGNGSFAAATPVSQTFAIAKAMATVSLANLHPTYTGSALPITVTTSPAGLSVDVTYNGVTSAPTEPGTYSIVATIADANYQGAATGTLVIAKLNPAISWNPASLVAGTPLGSAQLDATASVAGSFVYSPAAGTVLSAGLQNLSLTFTPADSIHYGTLKQDILLQVQAAPATVLSSVVNSASFVTGTLAPGEAATLFGQALASGTSSALTTPLPNELGGVTVSLQDSTGQTLAAQMLFVSPQQVNFLVPLGAQPGKGTLTITDGGQTAALAVQIGATAPGLFSADSTGTGAPAGSALHLAADRTTTYTPLATCAGNPAICIPAPIQFGSPNERIFLVLYGTGIRGDASAASVNVGSTPANVLYAGAQGQYAGLDQVNFELPRSLSGAGAVTVQVTVGGEKANALGISIQ